MNQLRVQRHLADMTQFELSKKSGVSRQTINKLENGDLDVASVKTLKALSEALNIKMSVLLEH